MSVEISLARGLIEAWAATQVLGSLAPYYPGFDEWLINKVMPGIVSGRDGMLVARDGGRVIGCAMWKADPSEPKLRCLRVAPDWAGRGLALRLMDRALKDMGADHPLITVAEELLDDYARMLVNRYGFALTQVEKGLYRPGRLEYVFNGHPSVGTASPY